MDKLPHVLVVPYPAQGHVMPLMEFSHQLVDRGVKVTFVNTEFIHNRVVSALSGKGEEHSRIHLVSVPDGLEAGDDRTDINKQTDAILRIMPGHLEDLIREFNESDDDKITCVIADGIMGWALEVAEKLGIKKAAFWPASVGVLALTLRVPKLMEAGVIDDNGTRKKNTMTLLSQTMPAVNTAKIVRNCTGDPTAGKLVFLINQAAKLANWQLCNSFYELEPEACDLIPNLLTIGPLLASNWLGQPAGNFWSEDLTCLSWLDQQPARSVIYIAFGSLTIFNQHQFHELAHGLELVGRPFLWVVRPDLTDGPVITYPDGFRDRVAHRGKMVEWAPQKKVLAHPSIACFMTHCGWNSTMDGLTMGVPLLCWPLFADQFHNQIYICDIWKVGLGLHADENVNITGDMIRRKMEELLGDEGIRSRSLEWKEMARKSISDGGSSLKNFEDFIKGIKC